MNAELLYYAKHMAMPPYRWPTFPVGANKTPCCKGGFKAASTDPTELERMFAIPSAEHIGLATGTPSGIIVIDVDCGAGKKNAADARAWLDAALPRMPRTRRYATQSGGQHIMFQHVEGAKNTASLIAPGIDTRAEGGYVILWPLSRTKQCPMLDASPPASCPDWLVPLVLPRPAPDPTIPPYRPAAFSTNIAERDLTQAGMAVARAQEGQRNETLNAQAFRIGTWVGAGIISHGDAGNHLIAAAAQAGIPIREAMATIKSGITAGMKHPKQRN